jgi:PEP-CTERM motif
MQTRVLLLMLGVMIIFVWWRPSVRGDIMTVTPIRDNSMYSENNNSNALGPLFVGRTGTENLRRALMRFDVSAIPVGAIIDSVSLDLNQLRHGTGTGSAPTAGDATWNFRQFNTAPWTVAGGDFGSVSGTTTIGITDNIVYTFSTQPGMVADVQSWVNNSATNFGWLLKASTETISRGAREFSSREALVNQRPRLVINYTAVPEPSTVACLGVVSIATFAYRLTRRR